MRQSLVLALFAVLGLPYAADAVCTKCVATEVTAANAAKILFGGTDTAGGIGDWYLTNKKVEIVIDDVENETIPVVGGSVVVNKTSSNAVATGGTLVDAALYKQNNDQLPQSFQVGGLSLANVLLFRKGDENAWPGAVAGNNPCISIDGGGPAPCASDLNCASITVFGIMLFPNVSSPTTPTLRARTRYQVCDGEQQVQMRTEIWNQSGSVVGPMPIIDIFLWGGRGLDAFVPNAGRGFNHPELDLSQAAALLTGTNYWFAPGNVSKLDGKMHRNKASKAISYGHLGGIGSAAVGQNDTDGPGVAVPTNMPGVTRTTLGLHGNLLSAALIPDLAATVANNASRIFNRLLIMGKKNDGHSVTGDPKNPQNIFTQLGYPTGVQPGSVSPGSKEEGTIVFIRQSGDPLSPSMPNNSPVTSVRTKGGFKVVLPAGTYVARGVFPGRPDILSDPFTVVGGVNPAIKLIAAPADKVGRVTALIIDADSSAPIPAKVSFSPSPVFRRDFEALNFDLRTGMCSNNLNGPACTTDAACGGGNTCFRTCSNKQPTACTTIADCDAGAGEVCATDGRCRRHACDSDTLDCEPGNKCVADAESIGAEGYPGGAAQLNVIYTADGKIKQGIKPGTYTVTVSRGPEYSARQFTGVTIAPGATVDIGGGSPITLKRVVNTTGWMSADFHIHSARSLDSSAPLEARVRSFAAEGVDVMVSTDHDIVSDYTPAIKKMKLTSFVGSIVGTEVTTSVGTPPYFSNAWGHVNAWPQPFLPNERRSGSAEDENVSANIVYDRLRTALGVGNLQCIGGTLSGSTCAVTADCKGGGVCTDVGTPVLQLNHVRAGVSGVVNIGFFDNIGYNPSAPITDCQKYPVICPTSQCFNGTNDGTACVTSATCTGGGVCGCASASVPSMANGCNDILNDLNVVPQASLCTTAGCGSGFEIPSGTRNIDADMMEVDNGGNASGWPGTKELRRDWLSLINQGVEVGAVGNRHPMWATGVSDTHRLVAEIPGYSRTFVKAGDLPNPSTALDIKAFNQQVLAGNMFGSTGPFLAVTADTGSLPTDLGGTLDASGGTVNLNINVQAAPWIPIDEVRVIKNGCVLACFNSSTVPAVAAQPAPDDQTTTGVVRFTAIIPDAVTEDSYYIVEASPDLPASGGADVDPFVNAVASGMFPLAYTNPIFADFDGGGYTGIGTPAPVCGALPPSCSAGAAVASAPSTTMFAKVEPEPTWLDKILAIVLPSVQAHDAEERPDDEAERLRLHEETIRKAGSEYFPRQFFVIPTPQPEAPAAADKPKE